MKEVIKLFKLIKETSGLNDKKYIITENQDNDLFCKCLQFLLDNNVTTGISEKKISKKIVPENKYGSLYLCKNSTFDEVINYLADNNTGKDSDIYEIQAFLSGHEEDRAFFEQMITKKYRLGADAKLVNKCIPGLIPTFDVMLGTSIEKVKMKPGSWFSISRKMNGSRCIFYKGEFYTRQGKRYPGLDHIKSELAQISNDNKYVYDGELLYKNSEGLTDSEAFQKGVGIANSKSASKEELKFVIFDIITETEFECKKSEESYKVRRNTLLNLKELLSTGLYPNIEVVDMYYEGTDQSQIWEWLDYAEANDIEGVMVSLDAPYECKRTKNLIKVKKFYTYDLPIIGSEEGTGRNKGVLGALVVDFKGNGVNVGSGFDDAERKKYWKNRDELIGRVAEIKYKEVTKNKDTGLESLQFPVFCGLREQGKEVSYD